MIGRFFVRLAVPAVLFALSGCCIPPWHCGPTWGFCPIKSALFGYGPYGPYQPYAPYGPQPYYPSGPAMYSDGCVDCGPGGQQFLPPVQTTPNGAEPGPQLLTPVPTPTEPTEIDQTPANQSSQAAPTGQPVGYWNPQSAQQPSQPQQNWNQQPVQQQSWTQQNLAPQPVQQQSWSQQPVQQQNWNQQIWAPQPVNQQSWNQQGWGQQPMYPAQPTPWVEEPAGQVYPSAGPGYLPNGNGSASYSAPQATMPTFQSAYQNPQGYHYQSQPSPNWDRARKATDFVKKLPSRAWEGLKGFAPDRRPRGQMAMAQAAPTSQRHGSPQHLASIAQTLEAQGRGDQAQRIYSQIQAQDSGLNNGQMMASQSRQPQLPPDYDIAQAQPPVIQQPGIQLAGSTNQPPAMQWQAPPRILTAPQMQSTPLVTRDQAMANAGAPQLLKSAQHIPPSDRFPKLGNEWQIKPESSAGPTYQPAQQVQFIPERNTAQLGRVQPTTHQSNNNAAWNSEFQRLFARDGRLTP